MQQEASFRFEVHLYRKRWFISVLIGFIASMSGFSTIFLGVINETLSSYFGWSPQLVDWFSLSLSVGVIVAALPVGIYSTFKPLRVKLWFNTTLLIQGTSFVVIVVALLFREYPWLILVAQLFGGFNTAIFLPVTGLAITTWFREREQATIYGIAWSGVSVGNLLATGLPAIILHAMQTSNDKLKVDTFSYLYGALAAICYILLFVVWTFIPDLPLKPPSHVEGQRRRRFSKQRNQNWRISMKNFFTEIKTLFTNRNLICLVSVYALFGALINAQFLLMPTVHSPNNNTLQGNHSHSNTNEEKAIALTSLSVGAMVGAVVSGVLLDRLKSYQPMAGIIATSTFLFSLLMLFSYVFSSQIALNFMIFFVGATISGGLAFFGEILKQHAYPISETTQGITVMVLLMIFQIILAEIGRVILVGSSGTYFFVYNSVCSLIIGASMFSINPVLTRFNEENKTREVDSLTEFGSEKI